MYQIVVCFTGTGIFFEPACDQLFNTPEAASAHAKELSAHAPGIYKVVDLTKERKVPHG